MIFSKNVQISDPPSIWFSKRFCVAVLLFFGLINMYALRGNLSIAVVEMTSNKTIIDGNQTIIRVSSHFPPHWKAPVKVWCSLLYTFSLPSSTGTRKPSELSSVCFPTVTFGLLEEHFYQRNLAVQWRMGFPWWWHPS